MVFLTLHLGSSPEREKWSKTDNRRLGSPLRPFIFYSVDARRKRALSSAHSWTKSKVLNSMSQESRFKNLEPSPLYELMIYPEEDLSILESIKRTMKDPSPFRRKGGRGFITLWERTIIHFHFLLTTNNQRTTRDFEVIPSFHLTNQNLEPIRDRVVEDISYRT